MSPTLYGGGEFAQSRFILIRIGIHTRSHRNQGDATFVIWKKRKYINQLQACTLRARNDGVRIAETMAEIYSAAILSRGAVTAALFMKRAIRGTISERKREPLNTP
jgi:hypothetical protein